MGNIINLKLIKQKIIYTGLKLITLNGFLSVYVIFRCQSSIKVHTSRRLNSIIAQLESVTVTMNYQYGV